MPRETEINFRKGTALQWATSNPVLETGELGFESDTLKIKIGDGSTAWNSLPYVRLDGGVIGSGGGGGGGGGSSSSSAQVTTPAQITDFSATPSNQPDNGVGDRIVLNWTPPSDNGYAINAYSVDYSTDDTNWTGISQFFLGTIEPGMTLSPTNPGQNYYFRIQASNINGSGPWSASDSAVMPKPGCTDSGAGNYDSAATYDVGTCTPDQITDLSSNQSNLPDNGVADRVVLTWTTPSGNGSAITGQSLEYSTDQTTWAVASAFAESGMTWSSGTPGTVYYFRVRALNANGEGAWSNVTNLPFPKPGCTYSGSANYDSTATYSNGTCLPDQIADFSATPSNQPDNGAADRIELAWTTPSDNGSAITGYSLEYSSDNTTWNSVSGTIESGMTWSSGTPGTNYHFRIRASNANGDAAWASDSAVMPKPGCTDSSAANYDSVATYSNGTCLPDQIADFSATPSNFPDNGVADRIELTWTTPSDNGSAITGYSLEYSSDEANWTQYDGSIASGMTFGGGSSVGGQMYYFRIRASNANGDAAWASDSAVLPKPGCMDSSAANYDSMATYSNASCYYAPAQINDFSATPSNQPDNGAADRIELAWTTPSDNGSAITGYSLEYSSDNTTWNSVSGTIESGMTWSSGTPGTNYHFRIRASNANGDAAWASDSAVMPKPGCTSSAAGNYDSAATYSNGSCTPDQITDLSATPSNFPDNNVADGIVLTWTAPSDNGSAITGYSFEFNTDNGPIWTVPTFGGTIESGLLFSGLNAGQTYYFRVRASSANGDAGWSTSASAVSPKPGCTDSAASNYDGTATYDNGSCSY